MVERTKRLKQLLTLQEQLKSFHEMRRAGYLANAAAAGRDIADIMERQSSVDSLSSLFPDVYAGFVEKASTRQRKNEMLAASEAAKVATETARTNMVERSWREALRDDERKADDRAALEAAERMRKPG